jgi:hypothetical protein
MKTYISNFWWGSSVDSHKLHWQRWSKLSSPKGNGGMGFRDMPLFNQAMLVLTVKIRQPSHEFTFGVGMSFILYPLVLTPVV